MVGDTTLLGGHQYKVLRTVNFYPGSDTGYTFERIDSSTGCIYRWTYNRNPITYETKIDSLFAQPGDTIMASWEGGPANSYERTICESIVGDTVSGVPTQVRHMRVLSLNYTNYSLAEGIGFLDEGETYDFGESWISLVYSRINGVEYRRGIKTGTLKDILSYYPLNDGDYWEYKVDSHNCNSFGPCQEDTSAFSVQVIGDTLLGAVGGTVYYKIILYKFLYPSPRSESFSFERIDPLTGCVLGRILEPLTGEPQVDSLFAEPGDTFLTLNKVPFAPSSGEFQTFFDNVTNDTILGVPTRLKHFDEYSLYESGYVLAKGFGISAIFDSWDFGYSKTTLVYAEISGKEYGTKIVVGVKGGPAVPVVFNLFQNYPDPFNPTTTVTYELPFGGNVTLKIYDILGREVATLVDGKEAAGFHSAILNAGKLASGAYFCRLEAGAMTAVRKMVLVK